MDAKQRKRARENAKVFCAELEKRLNRPCYVVPYARITAEGVQIQFRDGVNMCCTSNAWVPVDQLEQFVKLPEAEKIQVSWQVAQHWLLRHQRYMGAFFGQAEILEESLKRQTTV